MMITVRIQWNPFHIKSGQKNTIFPGAHASPSTQGINSGICAHSVPAPAQSVISEHNDGITDPTSTQEKKTRVASEIYSSKCCVNL